MKKNNTLDNIVAILVLEMLALFGLRGVLPDVIANGQLPLLFAAGIAVVLGYAIGQYASRCEPSCDPEFCVAR